MLAQRNQKQKDILQSILSQGKLSHAYLFYGRGPSKKEAALAFAESILGGNLSASSNPDLILIDRSSLKIADMRKLISDISLKPFYSKYKVVIIEDFEEITPEASNSILKTLEEPNPSTILILLAENPKKILPTILSRVQSFYFDSIVAGRETVEEFSNLRAKNRAERLIEVKSLSSFENDELKQKIRTWLEQEEEILPKEPQRFKNLQLLQHALSGLERNFNKKMVLEKLFLNLV